MFREQINTTPFADEYSNEFFAGRVESVGAVPGADITFLSTLRALIYPRLAPDEKFEYSYRVDSLDPSSGDDYNHETLFRAFESFGGTQNKLVLISLISEQDAELVKRAMAPPIIAKRHPDWHRVDRVEAFFRKAFFCECYINPDTKSTMVMAYINKTWMHHYIQCAIPVFLPWYFEGDKKPSEKEVELLDSLRDKSPDRYKALLSEMACAYNFRETRIRALLEGFESRFVNNEIAYLNSQIENFIGEINGLTRRINEILENKRNTQIRLVGLESERNKGGDSELMEFFIGNPKLVLRRVTDQKMEFFVRDYLYYWDEDGAKTLIDNPNSYFYKPDNRNMSNVIPSGSMKMLLESIFVEQRLKIRVCSAYRLTLGSGVTALSHYNYGSEAAGYTPNPHIDFFSCLGAYASPIIEYVQREDYIGAVSQCIASAQSLNVLEAPTMNQFMGRLYNGEEVYTRCIELPDGTVATPKEAIKWLMAEKENKENEQTD